MTLYYLTPISCVFQYFNDLGVILSGGKIHTYVAGSSTPQNTYTDITGGSLNANPIILAANGRLNNVQIWQAGGVNLKIVVTDANDNQIGPVFDQVSGINDPATTLATLANPATGFGADIVANAVRSYDIFASMRSAPVPSLSGPQTLIVISQGGSSVNDGNGGKFMWSASSTASDDGVSVIKPTAAGGIGRYLRLLDPLTSFGTFTGTVTGMTSTTTGTVYFTVYNRIYPGGSINDKLVSVYLQADLTGTSNTTGLSLTGLNSDCFPSQKRKCFCGGVQNNSGTHVAEATINTNGTIDIILLQISGAGNLYPQANAFLNSGGKGLLAGWQVVYNL